MAYVFLSDGGPEAEEYESNYFYFDESNPEAVAAIEKMLSSGSPRNSVFKAQVARLCRSSFERPVANRKNTHRSWAGYVFGFLFNAMGVTG